MSQEEALKILKLGHNTYITGPAGSGKTHVLNTYISFLRERGVEVAVTASTGIAATHLGGQTIHSWSGIGIRDHISEFDLENFEQKRALWKRYEETKVLIIDEISMLAAHQLDMIDAVARHMKRSSEPFGGMQVIFSGDFFQLPPIGRHGDVHYAFHSHVWSEAAPVTCYLDSQHRQINENDKLFEILEAIRRGDGVGHARTLLNERIGKKPDKNTEVTKLFTHNVDIDRINEEELDALDGKLYVFTMTTKGSRGAVEVLKNGCLAPEVLRLKVGAWVMFVKNDPAGMYVNGTLGRVDSIKNGVPRVRLKSGRVVVAEAVSWNSDPEGSAKAEIQQVPLRLAWAITIHKSQGMTLDGAQIDLSKTFVSGQGYVALSRVRSLDGVFLEGINDRALEVSPEVQDEDVRFRRRSEAARARLAEIGIAELETKTHSFLLSIGASLEPIEREERSNDIVANKKSTIEETRELLEKGLSLERMAEERGLKEETIIGHIEKLLSSSEGLDISHLRPAEDSFDEILDVFKKHKNKALTPVMKALKKKGIDASYSELRLIRLFAL